MIWTPFGVSFGTSLEPLGVLSGPLGGSLGVPGLNLGEILAYWVPPGHLFVIFEAFWTFF